MRIIISPAKKMNDDLDGLPPRDLPVLRSLRYSRTGWHPRTKRH